MNEALNNEQRVVVSVPGPEVAKEIETIDRLEEAQKDDRFITKQMAIGGGLSVVIFSFPLLLSYFGAELSLVWVYRFIALSLVVFLTTMVFIVVWMNVRGRRLDRKLQAVKAALSPAARYCLEVAETASIAGELIARRCEIEAERARLDEERAEIDRRLQELERGGGRC
jgi:Flp pilus assembly protein TadB